MLIKCCWIVFVLLLGLFIFVLSPLRELAGLQWDFSNAVFPLGILGALLAVLVAVTRMGLLLKGFLLATGISAAGWPISLFLHGILFNFFPSEPFTYILLFFICIPAFIIGAIGSIALGIKSLVDKRRINRC
jgi:hypothetical protein